ncbi:taste receptor type 2 member 38 [Kryptolebias marmoratus]|uniref:taste receptor type 2 member 38 n=1 Tax=Kryptolebias marmoratus TaxID=37003 RepID=UPI0007F93108|nr:taste receptor type 2 member 38 [Kryptolebias marmoratus]
MMLGVSKLTLWVLTGLVAVTSVFSNVYMFLMSLWNKNEKKERSPSETIVMALAVANVSHQLVCYFWMTVNEVDSKCYMAQMFYTVLLLIIFSFKFTIMWDTSFLTFYYSTKLVSTPNHCYTQIQAAILKHVTLAIFFIPMCGLACCIPTMVLFQPDNHTTEKHTNEDCGILLPKTTTGEFYDVVFLLLSDVVPGMIMLKCCISISVHLVIHLRHMKASNNGAHRPKLGSQLRVVQMSLLLVGNFIVYLVVDLYMNYQIVVNHDTSIGVTFFVTSVYTTVTAMVLIYGKKTLWKTMIHDLNTCLDEYWCLSCLKLPEHKTTSKNPAKVEN